jgi:6-phosphogluconate dehydrogenase
MEAYQFRRIVNLHQGFTLVRNVSDWNAWPVKLIEVARIWTAGCIIKSDLMKDISLRLNQADNLLFNEP